MRKVILAIFAVAILAITMIPMESDADPQTEKVRWSAQNLYHVTAVAEYAMKYDRQGFFIYEEGEDDSMIAYISDPTHMKTPAKGITNLVAGKTYEVYSFDTFYDDVFRLKSSSHMILGKYNYALSVPENSVLKMEVKSIVTFEGEIQDECRLMSRSIEGTEYHIVYTEEITRVSYNEGTQYWLTPYDIWNDYLYEEAVITMESKQYAGSPMLYVVICAVVTILIAALVAYCGRRPKLD